MNLRIKSVLFGAALMAAACGGNTVQPVAPVVPEPTPTPQATPPPIIAPPIPTPSPSTAPPAPTPEPCTQGLCEDPTTATTPPARLTVRLFTVEDGAGRFYSNWDPAAPIPPDFIARVDVTGKDEDGYETNGSVEPEWHLSNKSLVKVSGNHTHQRRLRVLDDEGMLDVWVTQQGVTSNVITLKLVK